MVLVLMRQEARLLRRDVGAGLVVHREDIRFRDDGSGWVSISVTVRNVGEGPSQPTRMRIDAAPLGAFVPGRRIGVLPVPGLAPGSAVELRTRAWRGLVQPLGSPRRIKPHDLLTAIADPDPPRRRRPPRLRHTSRRLPPDPLDFLGRGGVYWAGNINVFIGDQAVERHRAEALRIYPGRKNMALFFVGSRPDGYMFQFSGVGATWSPALSLIHVWHADSFSSGIWIEPGRWVTLPSTALATLDIFPPRGCQQGELYVHVIQGSTGKEAVVEFSLDPRAQGPGCYVV